MANWVEIINLKNMRYLIIDGCYGGTGIRDKYNGGYIDLNELNISEGVGLKISKWVSSYNNEFFNQYSNKELIDALDKEGIEIACSLRESYLGEIKIEYYSDAKRQYLSIDQNA